MNYLELDLTSRLGKEQFPSIEDHYKLLWRLALSLEKHAAMSIDAWCPPADSPKASLLNAAFDRNGPTLAAIAMAKTAKGHDSGIGTLAAWNGVESREGGATFSSMLCEEGLSNVNLVTSGFPKLMDYKVVASIMMDALEIWPSMVATAGNLTTKYFTKYQVFKDRPAAGWMLYLPRILTTQQVPEARALIPVMDGKMQTGTVIVSVTNGMFDVNNPEHIKIANAIEVRLADQDLLPRFADL